MKQQMPQVLKGFRDFLPEEKRRRDFVMRKIVDTFKRYGFEPLETPTLEYRETIMGKYGDEADKLVYEFTDKGDRRVAMRYDQTVPTARVIANYQSKLPFPFRRYQTQNVFRADKPQKGRYREFTQCDIDIFGSSDALSDAEILATTYAAYKNIGFENVILRINDRQTLLSTLAPFATDSVSVFSIIQSLDKLDKMSRDDVCGELQEKSLSREGAQNCVLSILEAATSQWLEKILRLAEALGVPKESLKFSPTTARGLDYYTGMIFEVRIPGYEVGSVGGGGRYDNLIRNLSGVDIPAVGMAFGFDRTVEAAEALGLITTVETDKRVLMTIFDDSSDDDAAKIARALREMGVSVELYPKRADLSKQLKYADKKGLRYIIVSGPEEKKNGTVLLKDMKSGEQKSMPLEQITALIK